MCVVVFVEGRGCKWEGEKERGGGEVEGVVKEWVWGKEVEKRKGKKVGKKAKKKESIDLSYLGMKKMSCLSPSVFLGVKTLQLQHNQLEEVEKDLVEGKGGEEGGKREEMIGGGVLLQGLDISYNCLRSWPTCLDIFLNLKVSIITFYFYKILFFFHFPPLPPDPSLSLCYPSPGTRSLIQQNRINPKLNRPSLWSPTTHPLP